MSYLLEHVEQSIRERKLLSAGQGMLVAVSGGLDSVVLLYLLHSLVERNGWRLTVGHFNHKLRGAASDGDERFVRNLAAKLKLPCVTAHGDVRAHAKEGGLSLEMAARKLRHEFLARTAKRLRVSAIALAHHADDQVELFFLRLLRGTGGEGLAGMKWRAPSPVRVQASACQDKRKPELKVVRPLLDVSRTELGRFARENRIGFREDASNASRDMLRNRVRHELLPLLRRRIQPAANMAVLRLMDILTAESEVLSDLTRAWLKARRRVPFASLPVAVQRRVLQVQLQRRNLTPDFEMIEWLRANPEQAVSVSPVLSVFRSGKGLVQLRVHEPAVFNPERIPVAVGGKSGQCIFDGVRLQWQSDAVNSRTRLPGILRCECFDADKVGERILLRHWRAGDRFQPIGMPSPVKLQDWFTNRKIPRALRHRLVVAATVGGEIFWIEGQRIGEKFKLTPRTKRRLIWRWKRL